MSMISRIWREKIYNEITENKGIYRAVYRPINLKKQYFAHLDLYFNEIPSNEEIVHFMEKELGEWVTKFPLPVMVMASDENDEVISLSDLKPQNYLMGYFNSTKNEVIKKWGNLDKMKYLTNSIVVKTLKKYIVVYLFQIEKRKNIMR